MHDDSEQTLQLLKLAEQWDGLAREVRQWAKQWQPGDLPPSYLKGCADQLENNAKQLRDLVEATRRTGRSCP
jgi:hypothetical protein